MASSSDDNLDDSRKDDASPHDKAATRKVSVHCSTPSSRRGIWERQPSCPLVVLGLEEITLHYITIRVIE